MPRPRMSNEEYAEYMDFKERNKALVAECEEQGIPVESVKHGWHKSKRFSLFFKNDEIESDLHKLKDNILADIKAHAPYYHPIKRDKVKESHLLVVDPADAHFGKYATKSETGQESNLLKTEERFAKGVEGLINKTDYFNFESIVFVGGNDINHTDNPFGTTTAGTRQDTSGLWHEHYQTSFRANVNAIDRLRTIANVHFILCPSNHDFATGFFLAQALQAWYRNDSNVTFDVTPMHRKYIHYGTSLMGYTHGDGAKEGDLGSLMSKEAKKAWSESQYNYWYVHHIHHKDKKAFKGTQKVKLEKDYSDVTVINTGLNITAENYCHVEYLRSISGPDRWHFTNGYAHSPQAMEAFIHHPIYGQIDRITHLF